MWNGMPFSSTTSKLFMCTDKKGLVHGGEVENGCGIALWRQDRSAAVPVPVQEQTSAAALVRGAAAPLGIGKTCCSAHRYGPKLEAPQHRPRVTQCPISQFPNL
ncbi:hypothetical protein TIFTF001_029344 [Ficus carica]|uniref:Uncharacterized protein n=1 Tax=Ficus carica TaxID=3494 RepID=A0AA88DRC7_FICCA|nr:hypothetical protein TIFTF001_029344 [Ficus carica]